MKVLVVSDIHGNIEALRAVAAAEPGVDRVICLGDIVDYGPAPGATVRWVRGHAWAAILGNHDNAVAFGVDCRSAPRFRQLSVVTRQHTVPMLSAKELDFLKGLPTSMRLEVDGLRLALVHAAPGDPLFQYLPAADRAEWTRQVAPLDADLVLVGHTHLPALFEAGGTRDLNPGSVGLQRDQDPRAACAVIEDGEPALKRVAYDVDKTLRALWEWGLPHDVARSLERIYRGDGPLEVKKEPWSKA